MEPKTIAQPDVVSSRPWRTTIFIALLAGTLDAVAAIIIYQTNPAALFKFIASGAFGAGTAFSAGPIMIFWGVVFHYFIAFFWTALFFFLYPVFPWMRKNQYVTGLLYGIFVWIGMNQVVLPLSEIVQRPFNLKGTLLAASILMVAIGLPISILTHRYYARRGLVS